MDVHDDHWHLWAKISREGVHNGYPSINILHSPARYGKDSPRSHYTREDYDLVDWMAHRVLELPEGQKKALVIFWGAYPDAPKTKPERYKEQNVDPSNCRKLARKAMKKIADQVY